MRVIGGLMSLDRSLLALTLERLQAYATVQAVLEACAVNDQPLWTSCPRAGLLAGKEARYMEHETPYGELDRPARIELLSHELSSRRPLTGSRAVDVGDAEIDVPVAA